MFVVVSAAQLLAGLITLIRRRGGALSALSGAAGVTLAGLAVWSLSGLANPAALTIGVPPAVPWYGLLAVLSTIGSVTEAFRLRSHAVQIVPALTGLAFLTWLYGWLLA